MLSSFYPETALVLVNGIYFSGHWEVEFPTRRTEDSAFHRLDATTVDTPMMNNTDRFHSYHDDNSTAVRMDYKGIGPIAMLAIQPSDAETFVEWEDNLNRELINKIAQGLRTTAPRELRLQFPRFEMQTRYELTDHLRALGIESLFTDLSGIYEPSHTLEPLVLNQFIHKTFLSVDENRTESTTLGAIIRGGGPLPQKIQFDRPFYFAIYDYRTNSILFMGRMMDPTQ